jgi:hypothetical protein
MKLVLVTGIEKERDWRPIGWNWKISKGLNVAISDAEAYRSLKSRDFASMRYMVDEIHGKLTLAAFIHSTALSIRTSAGAQ